MEDVNKEIVSLVLKRLIKKISNKLDYSKGCEERKVRVEIEDEEAEFILILLKEAERNTNDKIKTKKQK